MGLVLIGACVRPQPCKHRRPLTEMLQSVQHVGSCRRIVVDRIEQIQIGRNYFFTHQQPGQGGGDSAVPC
jgi:hypothetical protein